MEIKKEETKDYAEIYKGVKRAFNSAEHADGKEQAIQVIPNRKFMYSLFMFL